jgi:hypothetical protein
MHATQNTLERIFQKKIKFSLESNAAQTPQKLPEELFSMHAMEQQQQDQT